MNCRRLCYVAAAIVFALAMGADIAAGTGEPLSCAFASVFAMLALGYDVHVGELRKRFRGLLGAEARAKAAFRAIKKAISTYEDGGA